MKKKSVGLNRGFTLVELIVAVAVGSLLTGAVVLLTTLAYNAFQQSAVQARAHSESVLLMQAIQNELRPASSITLPSTSPGSSDSYIWCDAGAALKEHTPSKGDRVLYSQPGGNTGYLFSVEFSKSSDLLLHVDVTVTATAARGGNIIYHLQTDLLPENLKPDPIAAAGAVIVDNTAGSGSAYALFTAAS